MAGTELTDKQVDTLVALLRKLLKNEITLEQISDKPAKSLKDLGANSQDVKTIQIYLEKLYKELVKVIDEDNRDPGWIRGR